MELTIRERLVLLAILPAESDLLTLRIVRELREALSFSEAELVDHGIENVDGRVTWREDGGSKDVDIGPKAQRIIAERLEELDREKKLTEDHLPLCDKFGIGD